MAVDPRRFLLNTDHPMDQVVWLHSGSTAMGASSDDVLIIPHGLPFTPLVTGNWALDSSFTVPYEFSSGTFPSGSVTTNIYGVTAEAYADATNLYISYDNTLGAATLYYRVFAFQPDDENHDLEAVSASADRFTFNSDYNYTKLFEIGSRSVSGGDIVIIPHGFGYRPQVLAWGTDSFGYAQPLDYQEDTAFSFADVVVTDSTVTFNIPAFSILDRIDYRIYIEESA